MQFLLKFLIYFIFHYFRHYSVLEQNGHKSQKDQYEYLVSL